MRFIAVAGEFALFERGASRFKGICGSFANTEIPVMINP